MIDVNLKYSDGQEIREIRIEGDRLSIGRGSDVDQRFDDTGLSRLNSTIYREGEQVWIVDENSTNGTFVNGVPVGPAGTPLGDGDRIKIGNQTELDVSIGSPVQTGEPAGTSPKTAAAASGGETGNYLLPLLIIGAAVFVIGISAAVIGVSVVSSDGNGSERAGFEENYDLPADDEDDGEDSGDERAGADNTAEESSAPSSTTNPSSDAGTQGEKIDFIDEQLEDIPPPPTVAVPAGKKYQTMTEEEKRRYIEVKTLKVARLIGNRTSKSIPPAAVESIKKYVDGYSRRLNAKSSSNCRLPLRDSLEVIYRRASQNAPFIIRNFYSEGLDPQIGLYLAMVESEHCRCLQSPTGPLGMFQFAYAAAEENGLRVRKNASPSNPDERCEPEPSSRAAAKYMKKLSGRFGTGPLSIPLAIASYNSGQGALSKNLATALNASGNQQRSFWTLVANADKLSGQFKMENIKYVPKFFAAAIIGENPRDFGIDLQPLSTYTEASQPDAGS